MNSPLHRAPGAGTAENLGQLTRTLSARLRAHDVPTPELDARLLVCHACGLTHEEAALNPERALSDGERDRIGRAAKRRLAREPLSRITGKREFWGLEFAIGPHSLDPRPDTETLVQSVLELAGGREADDLLSILDLGTGSGCVLVALLHELKTAAGIGVDINPATLGVARANALRHDVLGRAGFVCSSWAEPINQEFDFVIANPPYIRSAEIGMLEPEVARYDPHTALDGGDDGLAAYREILSGINYILAPGGWLIFEIGAGQRAAVGAMLADFQGGCGFGEIRQWEDLTGCIRCVGARRLRS